MNALKQSYYTIVVVIHSGLIIKQDSFCEQAGKIESCENRNVKLGSDLKV